LEVIANVAVFAPAAIVTVLGTPTYDGLEDERVTVHPPAGAAWLMVTVPVQVAPAVTGLGEALTLTRLMESTVSDVVFVDTASFAVIVAL
jgi:hypothetical protein